MRLLTLAPAALAAVALLNLASTATDGAVSGGVPTSSTRAAALLTLSTSDPVLAAVGDMACDPADPSYNAGAGTSTACAQSSTSDAVVADTSLTGVLGLGDYQYDCGDPADYAVSYNPMWGRLDALMNPVTGNHEYQTGTDAFGDPCPTSNTTAQNYFNHFGSASHQETNGHFSFDVGSWHLIGLNGNCFRSGVGGCSATSTQTTWLRNDLAATTKPCIAAFWHQPLFTGANAADTAYRPWWNALYAANADMVLNGHWHNYQRYPALNPSGALDPAHGITEYVVGTGGEKLRTTLNTSVVPQPTAFRARFGYLRLGLHATGWTSEFIKRNGRIVDTANGTCH